MLLNQVCFPVYRLTKDKPIEEGTKLLYRNHYKDLDTNIVSVSEALIDDSSIPGSFSMRRLKLKALGFRMYNIRLAIFMLSDFIKMAKPGYYFLDSSGKLFKYTKTTTCRLTFREITKIIPGNTTGDILEVRGEHSRFKTLFKVPEGHTYAGLLYYNGAPILYGTYDKKYKDTVRKI